MAELLAPCGDYKSLYAAVYGGADAVYLGLRGFNARQKAENFTFENLPDVTKFCHIYGVRVYVTLNTAVKQSELKSVEAFVSACKTADIDAFIISDFAVFDIIKRIAPEIPVHASTQTGVSNLYGAKFLEKLGFTRVVLARETSLSEIESIKKNTSLEIEYFVHGALCAAFSGKCLFSSMVNGNSGNRGRCLQPCRLKYTDGESGKEGYFLSASDLCLASRLDELKKAGVSSFKIEGRLRSPEYVYETSSVYRRILDGKKFDDDDLRRLKTVFNRGEFTSGYIFERDTRNIMSAKVQGNIGVKIGEVSQIIVQNGKKYSKICTKSELNIGDGYKILSKDGFETDGGEIKNLVKISDGYLIPEVYGVGSVFRLTFKKHIEIIEKKLPLKLSFRVNDGGFCFLRAECNGICAECASENSLSRAEKHSLNEETAVKSLTKLGNTAFNCVSFKAEISDGFFATAAFLNDLRRRIIEILTEKLLQNYSKNKQKAPKYLPIMPFKCNNNVNLVVVETDDSAELPPSAVADTDVIVLSFADYNRYDGGIVKKYKSENRRLKVFLKLLPNADSNDIAIYKDVFVRGGFDGLYCDGFYGAELAAELKTEFFAGLTANIFNTAALNYLKPAYYLASAELCDAELKPFTGACVFAYGYIPLMNLAFCPRMLISDKKCRGNCVGYKTTMLIDRKKYTFNIYRNVVGKCYFTLYNSVNCDISSKLPRNGFNFYINMIQCNKQNAEDVISAFREKREVASSATHTFGHLYRGVE